MIWLRVLIGIAAAALLVATGLLLKKFKFAKYVAFFGIACNAAVVITNWVINGYVPFISMYQVLAFVGICFPVSYLYIKYVRKTEISFAWFTLCAAVCLIGCEFMYSTAIWHRAPALQSVYFIPHVLCYMLSYSLCAVSFVLTIVMAVQKDKERKKETEKAIYSVVITAFPFMVAGMLLGAIWANECWGNYWSWDPKETWALVTTCLYALYFHCRKHKFFDKWLIPILILAFIALVITFIGINLVGLNAQHSYS